MKGLGWALGVMAGIAALIVAAIIGVGFFLSPQDSLRPSDVIVAVSGGETQQRAAEAIKLYRQGYAPKLIFSGAAHDKNGPSNAASMRQQALTAGVPSQDIYIEEDSANTAENATNTTPILKQLGVERVILVTSPYHQRRASIDFRRAAGSDIQIINHSSTDSSWRKNSWWTSPFTVWLTISELQKTLYVLLSGPRAG